jgi:hypothetical protein
VAIFLCLPPFPALSVFLLGGWVHESECVSECVPMHCLEGRGEGRDPLPPSRFMAARRSAAVTNCARDVADDRYAAADGLARGTACAVLLTLPRFSCGSRFWSCWAHDCCVMCRRLLVSSAGSTNGQPGHDPSLCADHLEVPDLVYGKREPSGRSPEVCAARSSLRCVLCAR